MDEQPQDQAPAGEPRRLLVAEDDDAARTLLQRYLESKGHEVTAVADGQAVVDALAEKPGAFDLVLLDVMMPKLTGFEVLERVRQSGDWTPVIMATAAARPEDIVRALEMGADDYVTKPFSFPVLLARMELRLRLRTIPPVPTPVELELKDVIADDEPAAVVTGVVARIRAIAERLRAKPPAAVDLLSPGSVVGDRYVIEEKIGQGGFGAVFRARHVDLAHDVAIKVMSAGASVEAFRREAQNACRVRHENAVRVLDFGSMGKTSAFLVMELLNGPTLEVSLRQRGRLPVDRAVPIMRALFAALAAAHRQGIIHRDVKPQNVVLHVDDGEREVPKLLDFGIAKILDEDSDGGRAVIGSSPYIAPERILDRPYDGRVDVYAAGVTLFRMLTGALPFSFSPQEFEKVALWHVQEQPPAPSTLNKDLTPSVDSTVLALLEKDPAKRPDAAEADALIGALVWG